MTSRPWLLLGLSLFAPVAGADELISIPTGLRVPEDQWSLRYSSAQALRGKYRTSLAHGVLGVGEGRVECFDGRPDFSFGYQLLPSLADKLPGLMIGIEQVGNQFRGRSAYAAMTFEFNQYGERNAESPVQFTIGGGSGRLAGLFFGLKLPATNEFSLISEYDTSEIAAGVELKLRRDLKTQWVFRRGSTTLQFEFRF